MEYIQRQPIRTIAYAEVIGTTEEGFGSNDDDRFWAAQQNPPNSEGITMWVLLYLAAEYGPPLSKEYLMIPPAEIPMIPPAEIPPARAGNCCIS